jgi:hypothetical protein
MRENTMARQIGYLLDARWVSDAAFGICDVVPWEGAYFRYDSHHSFEREDLAEIAITGGFVDEHVYGSR